MKVLALLIPLLFLSTAVFAQGGPPLLTDDPATPGNGKWEINAALQANPTDSGSNYQFPQLDINYGYGEFIQLNVVVGWINAIDYAEGSKQSGAGNVSTAVKWRFIDEEQLGVSISTYPRIDSRGPFSSKDPAINSPGTRYLLPLELSKTFGKFGINPEIGYGYWTQSQCEWIYGIAFSYEFQKDRELLFELHGRSQMGESGNEILYDVGSRYALAESFSVIGAVGHTVSVIRDEEPFWNLYIGGEIRM